MAADQVEALCKINNKQAQDGVVVLARKVPISVLPVIYEFLYTNPLLASYMETTFAVDGAIKDKFGKVYQIAAIIQPQYLNCIDDTDNPTDESSITENEEQQFELQLGVDAECIGFSDESPIFIVSSCHVPVADVWEWLWNGKPLHNLLPNYNDTTARLLCPPCMPQPRSYAAPMLAILRASMLAVLRAALASAGAYPLPV